MIALIQRVNHARVDIGGETVAEVGRGILALIGVEKNDSEADADKLLGRMLGYRIFPDDNDRMNCSLTDITGELLLVPQFTLAADTRSGTRPGFSTAADPARGQQLFEYLCDTASRQLTAVRQGRFGANMQVSLQNDGPATFWLQS
jgi:D-tyrosyl-tRNA(Tyr) deacylase